MLDIESNSHRRISDTLQRVDFIAPCVSERTMPPLTDVSGYGEECCPSLTCRARMSAV